MVGVVPHPEAAVSKPISKVCPAVIATDNAPESTKVPDAADTVEVVKLVAPVTSRTPKTAFVPHPEGPVTTR